MKEATQRIAAHELELEATVKAAREDKRALKATIEGFELAAVRPTHTHTHTHTQHGLSSNKMALITSGCGIMCYPSIK